MANRNDFGDLLEPGFRKIFDDKYAEIPLQFPEVLHVNTSSKQDEKDSGVSGFGLLVETAEQDPITYEDPNQMFDVSYVHKKYTKGFKVSREMVEDDQYRIMNKKPAALGRAARRTAEYYAANVFNNAFSSSVLGGDSKALCSTAHPRSDGGTSQSNASSTGIVFSETNLGTGMLALRSQLDDKGQKIMARARTLIVPPALETSARIVVNSDLRSGDTQRNDINVYKGQLKVVVLDYLTSDTAWFLMDDSLHELNWFWRVKPEFKQDNSFDTDEALFKVRERFSYGWSDFRGFWGSKGDGADYTG